jgi:hypothetical protein
MICLGLIFLCRVFGLINFLNFAKIFQKSWEAKNKLKGSGKMKHLLMFSTNKEEVVGDLFPLREVER